MKFALILNIRITCNCNRPPLIHQQQPS